MPKGKIDQQHPLIEMRGAVVVRSGKPILEISSFALEKGESAAILGPNGSGKSTFIGLITREVFPLHHDIPPILFDGCPRIPLEDIRKRLGIVSATMQDQMTVHLSALEIVGGGMFGSLGIPRHKCFSETSKAKALEVMEMMGVSEFAHRDVMTLSTGQARRVLFARALIRDPELIVLDEPCSGLDPSGMYQVRKSMRRLSQQGKSIMLVTQHPEDVIPEIKRVLLLKQGKVFADGKKEELLTTESMSALYDEPLQIACSEGYYSLVSKY